MHVGQLIHAIQYCTNDIHRMSHSLALEVVVNKVSTADRCSCTCDYTYVTEPVGEAANYSDNFL